MTPDIPEKYSAQEWEHFRKRFSKSILKTTEIAELGRSVGVSWPFKGSDENPEKYIKFDFEELQSVPGLVGKKKRVHDLMDVLREILAFDDPFADMMDTVEEKNKENRVYELVLKKLNIPESYPVNLMYFSPEIKKSLHNNGVKTLIEVINFGKKTTAKLESSDDLHAFINGLALINETTIKKHLPFRVGQLGLHLPEAIGLLVRNLEAPIQVELLHRSGISLTDSESSLLEGTKGESLDASLKVVSVHFNELCQWFDEQIAELRGLCNSTESVERYFLPVNDAKVERVSIALVQLYLGASETTKSGMFGKVSSLFKR